MIEHAQAIEFVRPIGNGRTKPALIVVEDGDGNEVELVAKLPAGCFEGVGSLVCETIGACLAADLGIRVPQPYYVHLYPGWIDTLLDEEWAALACAGPNVAFGSKFIAGGFSAWQQPASVSSDLAKSVALALSFDAGAENSDRRPENPNCLRRGDVFYLFDHELCFPQHIIGRPKPWVAGGLQDYAATGKQIFIDALRKRHVDWGPVANAWSGLSDEMIDAYGSCVPPQWAAAAPVVERAKAHIKAVRDNIDGLVAEIERVLTC